MNTFYKVMCLFIALCTTNLLNAQDYFGIYGLPNSVLTLTNGNTTEVPTLWFSDNTNPDVGTTSDGPIGVSAAITDTDILVEPAVNPASSPHTEAMFGGQSNNDNKILLSKPLAVPMLDVGIPSNEYYMATDAIAGINVATQFAFEQYVSTEGLLNEALTTNTRYYMGTITYTFTEPVINPYFHVTGLGGFFSSTFSEPGEAPPVLMFSIDMDFIPNDKALSIEQISGTTNTELTTTNNPDGTISNTYPYESYAANLGGEGVQGAEAGSGSFKILGSGITEVSFAMYMVGKTPEQVWSTVDEDPNPKYTGDRFNTTWTLATESILPVELLNFNARKSGDISLLNWASAEELDFSHYDVERSSDGAAFSKIGEVVSTGSNSKYEFTDRAPVEGVNYYRLKMFDVDGTYEYSVIRSVDFQVKDRDINIYPNPTVEKVFLEKAPKGAKVSVLTADGKLVSTLTVGNAIRQEISLKGNDPGIYVIKVDNNGKIDHHRIILVQ